MCLHLSTRRVRWSGAAALIEPAFLAAEYATMLITIFLIIMAAWFIGVAMAYTLGGLIHLFLLLALIVLLVEYLERYNPL